MPQLWLYSFLYACKICTMHSLLSNRVYYCCSHTFHASLPEFPNLRVSFWQTFELDKVSELEDCDKTFITTFSTPQSGILTFGSWRVMTNLVCKHKAFHQIKITEVNRPLKYRFAVRIYPGYKQLHLDKTNTSRIIEFVINCAYESWKILKIVSRWKRNVIYRERFLCGNVCRI